MKFNLFILSIFSDPTLYIKNAQNEEYNFEVKIIKQNKEVRIVSQTKTKPDFATDLIGDTSEDKATYMIYINDIHHTG